MKDPIDEIKKKMKVLEPKFKEQLSKALDSIGNSLELLYEHATRDEKTGVYNYKFFKNVLERELERAKRGEKLSLIVIDIDFFKKVNDAHGHLQGDRILKELAKVIVKEVRKYDVVSRFGGEEFFVLLPDTSIVKAKKVAKRLKKNLWKNKVLKKYKITISMGVSEYKKRDSVSKIVKRADKALYRAKGLGRDRVEVG